MAQAHNRLRARERLKLAQLLIAGQADKNAWLKQQAATIAETQIPQ